MWAAGSQQTRAHKRRFVLGCRLLPVRQGQGRWVSVRSRSSVSLTPGVPLPARCPQPPAVHIYYIHLTNGGPSRLSQGELRPVTTKLAVASDLGLRPQARRL
jgi:hypothetical protein